MGSAFMDLVPIVNPFRVGHGLTMGTAPPICSSKWCIVLQTDSCNWLTSLTIGRSHLLTGHGGGAALAECVRAEGWKIVKKGGEGFIWDQYKLMNFDILWKEVWIESTFDDQQG